jgi:DNA-binding FrmR family transcriptional regulator
MTSSANDAEGAWVGGVAIARAPQTGSIGLVHQHLSHCVADAEEVGGADATDKIEEATVAVARLVKS